MKRPPVSRHPLLDAAWIVGLSMMVLAPAGPGCTSSTSTISSAELERRTPLQRRTGEAPRPPQEPAPGATRITGAERLQWDQAGKSLEQVQRWRYLVVIGLARREMKDVKCDASKGPKGPFVCSGGLPAMDAGNHQLRVVAVDERGGREFTSPWSRPILVYKE